MYVHMLYQIGYWCRVAKELEGEEVEHRELGHSLLVITTSHHHHHHHHLIIHLVKSFCSFSSFLPFFLSSFLSFILYFGAASLPRSHVIRQCNRSSASSPVRQFPEIG